MNVLEKEKQQKVINVVILGIESFTKKIATARDEYKKAMIDLTLHGTETYSQEYLAKKSDEVKSNFKAKMESMYADMVSRLENLRTLIQERDQVLDLSNPALSNALTLIETISGNLTLEECGKINANFTRDQSGLRALRAAYMAHGVISQGNVEKMIYNVNEVIDDLIDLAKHGTIEETSINSFAEKFAKFAALEGVTTEPAPDEGGFEEAMRKGAGLAK